MTLQGHLYMYFISKSCYKVQFQNLHIFSEAKALIKHNFLHLSLLSCFIFPQHVQGGLKKKKKVQHLWKNPIFFSLNETFLISLVSKNRSREILWCMLWVVWATMLLTTEQRGKLVDFYLAVESVVETKRAYCNHFNVRDAPWQIKCLENCEEV